jgi:4'-phosphopantetheinyl transferase
MEGKSGLIQVWTISVSSAVRDDESLLRFLSPEENLRANRFHKPEDHASYIVAHAGVRMILSQHYDIDLASMSFRRSPTGKPLLVHAQGAPPVHFNLSHSGALVVIAVSRDAEVGIDVEAIDPTLNLDEAGGFCSSVELAWLATLPDDQCLRALYRIWTIKEAMMKAEGSGLRSSLTDFSVDLTSSAYTEIHCSSPPSQPWFIQELEVPLGYTSALACRHSPMIIRQFAHLRAGKRGPC